MRIGRFLIRLFTPLAWLLFPFKAVGKENIPAFSPDDRLMICSNHISILDPVFLVMCQRRHVFFMAKAELFSNRLATWFFGKQLGAFPVHRGKGDTGAIDTAKDIVCSGKLLGIFPEGTRSKDGKLGRAKSGAALIASQTGATVIPVCIHTKGQRVRLFHRTIIEFGTPLSPAELHLQDPEHPDLRYASRLIMEKIGGMMGQEAETAKGETA